MNQRQRQQDGSLGKLPTKAMLANSYIPFQVNNPPKYDARRALIRGTLYPGLDLPFRGLVNHKEKPVTPSSELQVLGFAVQELALYLDTHPDDKEALQLYRKYQQLHHNAMKTYSETCRPVQHGIPVEDHRYTWLCDPWPWEYAANKEG